MTVPWDAWMMLILVLVAAWGICALALDNVGVGLTLLLPSLIVSFVMMFLAYAGT